MNKVKVIGAALVTVALLSGCKPKASAPAAPPPSSPTKAEASSSRLLAGRGLAGLEPVPASAFLPPQRTAELISVVYPDQRATSVSVTHDDTVYDVTPVAAVKVGDTIGLWLNHENAMECHGCSGAGSIFFLDAAGQRVVRGFPFFMQGSSWGYAANISWARLKSGEILALAGGGWSGQGCTTGTLQIVRLAPSAAPILTPIPSGFDNTGGNGSTVVDLVGVEEAGPGKLKARWEGKSRSDDGASVPIVEERVVRLDGSDQFSGWPYAC